MWKHWLAINYWCRAVLADILTFFIRKNVREIERFLWRKLLKRSILFIKCTNILVKVFEVDYED